MLDVRERAALHWSPTETTGNDEGLGTERFLQNLKLVAEAAGGTKQIRDLILQLAVRGRLCKPGSEGSAALVRQLREHRARLKHSGLRVPAEVTVAGGELPYEVPATWSWVRLGELGGIVGGGTPSKSNDAFWRGEIPWVSPKDMKRALIDDAEDHISEAAVAGSAVKLIPQNSLLYVVRGMILAHSFPVATTTREVTINQDMKALVLALPEMSPFVLRVVQALRPRVLALVERSSHGTCRLDSEAVERLPIALPPLADQKRIVAKVDQLMALCDELERRQDAAEANRRQLVGAVLGGLARADRTTYARLKAVLLAELRSLVRSSDDIEALRGACRTLGVRGVLTAPAQVSRDAMTLLDEMDAHREARIRAREARRPEPPGAVEEHERPFDLPAGWAWVRLGQLCWKVADGPHFSPKYVEPNDGVLFLSGRNIRATGFNLDEVKYVSRSDHEAFCARARPEVGDVLYTKGGTTGVALVNSLDREFSVWVHVAILKVDRSCVDPNYVAMALNSPHCYAQSQQLTHGTGNRDLGLTRMVRITLPLPPLEDQRCIVARVNELLTVCDDLERALRTADRRAEAAARAMLEELTRWAPSS